MGHSRKSFPVAIATAFLLVVLGGCGGGGGSGSAGSQNTQASDTGYLNAAGEKRAWLTRDDLTSARNSPISPLHNSYFMPVGTHNAALAAFSGTIRLTSFSLTASSATSFIDTDFPEVDMKFVSDGTDLVPVDREILFATNSSSMRLILQPGAVWSEPDDNDWSRASFPFVLTSKQNYALNGLATFVYSNSDISAIRVQIVQETYADPPTHPNLWGTLGATYVPENFADSANVIAQFQSEKQHYLPVASWSDLASQMKTDETTFNGGIPNYQVSGAGLIKDGTLYMQPCYTRLGEYPYCQYMRHGAYSATKSMSGAIAFLRLAQKCGDGFANLPVKDYLTVTASHNGWDNVTFLDMLNMATGIGDTSGNVPVGTGLYTFSDEESPDETIIGEVLFDTPGASNMLARAFEQGKYSWGPGVEMRYDSMHSFILSAAMDAYLKQKEGPNANLRDMLINEVYRPIGIAHFPIMVTAESDSRNAIPFMAFGAYPTADDSAKIAMLLQNDGNFNG